MTSVRRTLCGWIENGGGYLSTNIYIQIYFTFDSLSFLAKHKNVRSFLFVCLYSWNILQNEK